VDVEVTTRGPVAPENAELASEKIAGLESALRRPLRGARVVLLEEENQRIPHSARAEEEVWLEGKPIRGRVAAENMTQEQRPGRQAAAAAAPSCRPAATP
jgi:hypothetical protein